jgi:hypothetical protein
MVHSGKIHVCGGRGSRSRGSCGSVTATTVAVEARRGSHCRLLLGMNCGGLTVGGRSGLPSWSYKSVVFRARGVVECFVCWGMNGEEKGLGIGDCGLFVFLGDRSWI